MKRVFAAIAAIALPLTLIPSAAQAWPVSPDTPTPRVVNGFKSTTATFPYLVAIGDKASYTNKSMFDAQFCDGTLVSPTVVITAAHCIVEGAQRRTAGTLVVSVGVDLRNPDRVVTVSRVRVDPKYNSKTVEHDMAILKLDKPLIAKPIVRSIVGHPNHRAFTITVNPQPTAVPTVTATNAGIDSGLTTAGTPVRSGGWGTTSADDNNPVYPAWQRAANLSLFPSTQCGGGKPYVYKGIQFQGYTTKDINKSLMMCADGVNDAGQIVDTCSGDSGGPLVTGRGMLTTLIGVVSWGYTCATRQPGIYSRISSMTGFMKDNGVTPGEADPVVRWRIRAINAKTGAFAGQCLATAADPTCSIFSLNRNASYNINVSGITASGDRSPSTNSLSQHL